MREEDLSNSHPVVLSQLIEATLGEANNLFVEKERLRLEVDQLGELVKRQNDMISIAHAVAEENVKLLQACQVLSAKVEELEDDNRSSQAKLRSIEADNATLKENQGLSQVSYLLLFRIIKYRILTICQQENWNNFDRSWASHRV